MRAPKAAGTAGTRRGSRDEIVRQILERDRDTLALSVELDRATPDAAQPDLTMRQVLALYLLLEAPHDIRILERGLGEARLLPHQSESLELGPADDIAFHLDAGLAHEHWKSFYTPEEVAEIVKVRRLHKSIRGTAHALGIPVDLFTPVFAVSRISGWTAHVLEQYANNRLIRPRAR